MPNGSMEEIVEVYGNSFREIYSYCAYRLFSKHLTEDATSAVFLRLVEQYPMLRGESRRKIRSWLYGTASNVVARYLRDDKRRKDILAELARESQSRLAAGPDDDGRLDWPVLYEAIGRLKRKQQEILVLRYFQGLQTSTIADVLGMKDVTVRVQLSRAVKRLGSELEIPFGERHATAL